MVQIVSICLCIDDVKKSNQLISKVILNIFRKS